MQVRFIHSADWQLGMTRHFLSPEAQARYTQARIDAVHKLGELARRHAADFIVVAGDVFESHQLSPATRSRALAAIADLPVPSVFLPGNHDPLNVGSIWESRDFHALESARVLLLRDVQAITILPGVEIVGAPWRSKRPTINPLYAAVKDFGPAGDTLRIALGHGAVDTLTPVLDHPGVLRLDDMQTWLAEDRLHYIALGDRHSLTRVGESGRIYYSGTPEPTDFDEFDPGKALLVEFTSTNRPPKVQVLATGSWQFERRDDWQLDSAGDVDALAVWLAGLPAKERCIVKLTANGNLPLTELARFEALLLERRELFAALIFEARHNQVRLAVDPTDADHLQLQGFARDAGATLFERAADDDDAARDALVLLRRLLEPAHR